MSTDATNSSTDQPWTIGRLLSWTTEYLSNNGSSSPRLDAEVLLSHVRQCERIMLYTEFDTISDEPTRTAFRELVRRRAEGAPVAYLVGAKEFYSLMFQVNEHVLIPRPETEYLVVTALDLAKQMESPLQLADIGTGSGAVAVCLARELPHARVTAVDLSIPALDIARRNAQRHEVADRIALLESDLFAAVPAESMFDVIVSNPPYVSESELADLPRDVGQYEPSLALAGGQQQGAEITLRLIEQAIPRLHSGGAIVLETSPMLVSHIQQHLSSQSQMMPAAVTQDLSGLARIVAAFKR